jgi:hypothetical protein
VEGVEEREKETKLEAFAKEGDEEEEGTRIEIKVRSKME